LAKGRYRELSSIFKNKDMIAFHKPIYYALMYYMQDEYPNEYLRMGEELEETVQEIIAKVEQMRIDYA
ncbi:MAG: hypothetical protein AAF696_09730, partial [Bacteroidota bacterium]